MPASSYSVRDGNLAAPTGASKYLFADSTDHPVNPDIVVLSDTAGSTTPCGILEVKYRPTKKANRDEIGQLLTYMVAYNAPLGVLLFPAESEKRYEFLGQVDKYRLFSASLNICADDLEAEEVRFANEILGILDRQGTSSQQATLLSL